MFDGGDGIESRFDVLYIANLAGVALAAGGSALRRETCQVLGGMFKLNHGNMNAVALGHAPACDGARSRSMLRDALDGRKPR